MEKKVFEYSNKKEINLHSETNVTENERKIGNTIAVICYFAAFIVFALAFTGVIPFYSIFLPFVPAVIYLFYLVIKYMVFKKTPIQYQSYNKKVNGNDTEISNYEEKIINKEK